MTFFLRQFCVCTKTTSIVKLERKKKGTHFSKFPIITISEFFFFITIFNESTIINILKIENDIYIKTPFCMLK